MDAVADAEVEVVHHRVGGGQFDDDLGAGGGECLQVVAPAEGGDQFQVGGGLDGPDRLGADTALGATAAGDALTGAGHAAVEVHAVDTNRGVVLDAEIDVLADTEAEVAGLAEVALAQLVLLDLEATLENLLGLGTTDGDVDGDLLVTADTEGSDSVAGLACAMGNCGLAISDSTID